MNLPIKCYYNVIITFLSFILPLSKTNIKIYIIYCPPIYTTNFAEGMKTSNFIELNKC